MEKSYVSEFTVFMNHYLEEHPEVVEDQQRGWNIYWNHEVDFEELKEAEEDRVPDDSYGFNPVPHSVVHH
ncbi:MAG TPA: DUF3460 family protein [Thiobacillaceae bacterium]|nr:DUF3460 family protein [Thiobacillaceae bacterium]